MLVVSDTTAISNLLQIGKIYLLQEIFGQVLLPKAVKDELKALNDFGIDIQEIFDLDWVSIQEVADLEAVERLMNRLDRGESESIVLAQQVNADFLLIDEKAGRTVAAELSLRTIGVLGVLLDARKRGLEMDKLMSIGFRISKIVYENVIQIENKMKL